MRVLLDNNVHRRFAALLVGHDVVHAKQMGWSDLRNGELISAAVGQAFGALITADKNMQYQQSLSGVPLTAIVLGGNSIRLEAIKELAPEVQRLLDSGPIPGSFVTVGTD